MSWRVRKAWRNTLLAIASLAVGAPLFSGVAALLPHSPEAGYLLYPRLALCAPTRARTGEAAAVSHVRRSSAFRPLRTIDAVMPPDLGEHLGGETTTSPPLRTAGD